MKKLPEFEIKIGNQVFKSAEITEELKSSEETINEDLIKQPNLFAFYAVLESLAIETHGEAKLNLEMLEARLDSEIRKEAVRKGDKLTETKIANALRSDDKYVDAVLSVNTWRKHVGILKAVKDAFSHRKEVIIALASNMRVQLKDPSLVVYEEKAKEDIKK